MVAPRNRVAPPAPGDAAPSCVPGQASHVTSVSFSRRKHSCSQSQEPTSTERHPGQRAQKHTSAGRGASLVPHCHFCEDLSFQITGRMLVRRDLEDLVVLPIIPQLPEDPEL
uniref:Predicted gene 10643 n=1 Tax=Mus musculus TaxID=10090 RepID=Q3URG9_MOUSE|nr:unnamed protein product [Mus musculus]